MKVEPVPETGATNDELARGVNQLHQCLEDEKRKTAKHRLNVNRSLREIRTEQKRVAAALVGDAKRPKLGTMTTFQWGWRAALSAGSGIGGVFVLYRIALALWPSALQAIHAINQLAVSGKI